jgi:hypothetical protein
LLPGTEESRGVWEVCKVSLYLTSLCPGGSQQGNSVLVTRILGRSEIGYQEGIEFWGRAGL